MKFKILHDLITYKTIKSTLRISSQSHTIVPQNQTEDIKHKERNTLKYYD